MSIKKYSKLKNLSPIKRYNLTINQADALRWEILRSSPNTNRNLSIAFQMVENPMFS